MNNLSLIFALALTDRFRHWFAGKDGSTYIMFFFGVAALVALFVFGWAVLFRKQDQHHSGRSGRLHQTSNRERKGGIFSRKHRRKKHRPTNPTLAETGGLPTLRDPNTTPKSPL